MAACEHLYHRRRERRDGDGQQHGEQAELDVLVPRRLLHTVARLRKAHQRRREAVADDGDEHAVVAEGVESTETMELLEKMGCDMVQGYILTPPLPFDDIIVWLGKYKHHGRSRKLG